MNAVSLQSFGAAETVTGSKHLLKTPDFNILIDCGLFQGRKSLREQNWLSLPVQMRHIQALILTHAHLDHCGYIPLLVKRGFRGKIYMSKPTAELTKLILLDSAKLQEEDADRANRFHYSKHSPALALYTVKDAENSFDQFVTVEFEDIIPLNANLSFRFKQCGHILGACSAEVNCYNRKIVFSGDIGRINSPILEAPDFFTSADYVIMESTYGDKIHASDDPSVELAKVINETIQLGGNILIPSFAVGRAQELMYLISKLKESHMIPEHIPVFLDSPMAAQATEITFRYPELFKVTVDDWNRVKKGVIVNRDSRDTEDIINRRGSKIIIAASGMLSGGRVLTYLKHYIGDTRNVIFLIGFQAEGTRGRALLNQSYELKIHGEYFQVKARVHEITSLSAHADQAELLNWISKFKKKPVQILLVHGEPSAQEALRIKLRDTFNIPVHIMKQDEERVLFDL